MKSYPKHVPFQNVFFTCKTFNQKYRILKKIDEGHTANVYKIQDLENHKKLALKAYNHQNFQSIFLEIPN